MIREEFITKIGAVATICGVIIALLSWLFPTPLKNNKSAELNTGKLAINNSSIFDKNPLYTISSDTILEILSDVYIPAYINVLYIQEGKISLHREDIRENNYIALLKLKESSKKSRLLPKGKSFKITDSSIYGHEDREYKNTYVYLKVDNEEIESIKCLGKDNSNYITIGQFKELTRGIAHVNISNLEEF